jgi:hypothetical protein
MGNLRILCACLPLVAACGGGDMTALGGIYTIDSWTENTAGCDTEGGPAPFQDDTALYIKSESIFGTDFVSVVTCADIAECEAQLADDDIDLGAYFFEEGSDEDGWTESSAFAFENFDGMCEASGTTDIMTSPAEGQIRIETRDPHRELGAIPGDRAGGRPLSRGRRRSGGRGPAVRRARSGHRDLRPGAMKPASGRGPGRAARRG